MAELVLSREVDAVARACDWIEASVRGEGWSAGDVSRVVLSVGECVSNAVEHGGAEKVRVVRSLAGDELTVRVLDGGAGPSHAQLERPELPADVFATGGRGLFILSRLADDVSVDAEGGVRLTFRRRP